MVGNLGAEVAAQCHAEPEVLCSSAATSPLLHVAYKPFTGRLHSPGEYLLYGCELQGGEWQGAQLKLTRGQDERSAGWYRYPRAAETRAIPAGGSAVRAPFAALRARRGIPGGPLAYRSGNEPVPLSELERIWSSVPWAGRRDGISRSPGTPATRRMSRGSAQVHDPAFRAASPGRRSTSSTRSASSRDGAVGVHHAPR